MTKRAEIDGLLKEAAAKQQNLIKEEANSRQVLTEIKKNKRAHEQLLAELKSSSDELQRLLKRLQNQEIALPSPFIPLNEKKGKLPWPVPAGYNPVWPGKESKIQDNGHQ